jgi:hypothetical protein
MPLSSVVTMQTVEDFMREFFEAHADLERARLASWRPLWSRYFIDGYEPFSPQEICRS